MTRFHGISIVTIGAALSMTAGLAFAGDTVSADQILSALKPKPATRGLSTGAPVDTAAQAKEASFVDTLRNRKTRSLSLGERQEIAELAATKPKIDLEIRFDYNSAAISKSSMPAVQELGKALSNASLKGSTFVVAGHTDAIGSEAFNQDLSERRADTIKKYPDREVWSSTAPISSPSAMARPSRRIRTRRWTRSTAAFRSSIWKPRPRRNDATPLIRPPATAGGFCGFARCLKSSSGKSSGG